MKKVMKNVLKLFKTRFVHLEFCDKPFLDFWEFMTAKVLNLVSS